MFEAIASAAIAIASLFGVSADSAAQVACDVAADHYGAEIVCVYDRGSFDVFVD